ncbi:MAG: calcium/sodium antiporter [Kiloniellales bacterium]
MTYLALIAGLVLLAFGGEYLVRGAVALAKRLGVSPLLIGLTLVGFGTSCPELVASVQAALIGSPGIAVGNVVGSNILNILLILGITAVISSLATSPQVLRRDGMVLLGASLAMVAVCLVGAVGRLGGSLLVGALLLYLVFTYRTERAHPNGSAELHIAEAELVAPLPRSLWLAVVEALLGLAAVVGGAYLLVNAAIVIARQFGVSETVIGLTIVAGGTSLPELVTSVVAALRRHGDVALGNIIGSNIFNILGIIGVTALVRPIAVPDEIVRFDLWVMLAVALLLVVFAKTGWRLSRWEGAVFLAGYGVYLFALLSPDARELLGISYAS